MTEEVKEGVPEGPSIQEIANACADVLDEGQLEDIADQKTPDYALDAAYAHLIAQGIEDPEAFLIAKGILEEGEKFEGVHRNDPPA